MTDFRSLCAELVEAWDATTDFDYNDFGNAAAGIVDRARAALAQAEPERPTVMQIIELADEIEAAELGQVDLVRAVLTRWGSYRGILGSSPQPILVSERLPGPEDCDAEGRCWWGEPHIGDSYDATWNLCTQNDAEEFCIWGTKCGWLPAHALPLPSVEVE